MGVQVGVLGVRYPTASTIRAVIIAKMEILILSLSPEMRQVVKAQVLTTVKFGYLVLRLIADHKRLGLLTATVAVFPAFVPPPLLPIARVAILDLRRPLPAMIPTSCVVPSVRKCVATRQHTIPVMREVHVVKNGTFNAVTMAVVALSTAQEDNLV
jgi:hypothetical protein